MALEDVGGEITAEFYGDFSYAIASEIIDQVIFNSLSIKYVGGGWYIMHNVLWPTYLEWLENNLEGSAIHGYMNGLRIRALRIDCPETLLKFRLTHG